MPLNGFSTRIMEGIAQSLDDVLERLTRLQSHQDVVSDGDASGTVRAMIFDVGYNAKQLRRMVAESGVNAPAKNEAGEVEVDALCPRCGASLIISKGGSLVYLRCNACGNVGGIAA